MNPGHILVLLAATTTPIAAGPAVTMSPSAAVSAATKARIATAQHELRAAILSNDVDARVRLYRPDARSMPEYQPALYTTAQIAAYHRAMRERLTMTRFDPVTSELFDFGDAVLEFGTFTAGWTAGANAEERRGKYANLWAVEPDGSLRLKADVWGYFENLPNEEVFFVPMAEAAPPLLPAPADPELVETVSRLDQADARAVRTRDLEAKLAFLADDAIIMPFADTPKRGMAEIRPYLAAYTAAGEGIVFDDVRVWNAGVEQFGDYVVIFSKFHVDWRFPGNKGITKGGGLHLLKREPDGSLKRIRQIGTHDHVD
jgi:ketosteroid isomerase-like protein